jgi:hypothetical protein
MDKILFIDDELEMIISLKNECVNFNSVVFDNEIKNYFEFDKAGNEVKLKFDEKDFAYIFIHKSYKDHSIPSNSLTLISSKIEKNKLFYFSGAGTNNLLEKTINRASLYSNFKRFINHYDTYNDWYLLSLVDNDYLRKYGKKLFEQVRSLISNFEESKDFVKLCNLLEIPLQSYKLFNSTIDFVNEIEIKINEL